MFYSVRRLRIGLSVLAAVLAAVVVVPAFQTLFEDSGVDQEQYAQAMARQIHSIEDLVGLAEEERALYLTIVPPGLQVTQAANGGIVPFSSDDLPASFVTNLVGHAENAVAVYPVEVCQDFTNGYWHVLDANGLEIATLPPAGGISPLALAIAQLGGDTNAPDFEEALARFDVSRVRIVLPLVAASDVEVYLYAAQTIESAAFSLQEQSSLMLMSGVSYTDLCIAAVALDETGQIVVTVGCPNGFTNSVDIFATTNLLSELWSLAATNLPVDGNTVVWFDTSPTNEVQFYTAGNADADADRDGLADARERLVYRTDPNNPDADMDGVSDGDEIAAATDPFDRLSAPEFGRGIRINELMYNAPIEDPGNEWLELFNTNRFAVDLSGFVVQVGVYSFTNAFAFPSNTIIPAGSFFLIGGDNVTNADQVYNFSLPNRFSAGPTAGVRLMAPTAASTQVVDTLLYATNNANALPTVGFGTDGFAPWAAGGYSVMRARVGYDTDHANDWTFTNAPNPMGMAQGWDIDGDGISNAVEIAGYQTAYGWVQTDFRLADSDGDGLNDGAESTNVPPTDPTLYDTDGDAFPWSTNGVYRGNDGDEVLTMQTDPTDPDSDDDGLPDGWEAAMGLDPNDTDSDDNGKTDANEDTDGDSVSNIDEYNQNSNPADAADLSPHDYRMVLFHAPKAGWKNGDDMGTRTWAGFRFENVLQTSRVVYVVMDGGNTAETFNVEWRHVLESGRVEGRTNITWATFVPGSSPELIVRDAGTTWPNENPIEYGADLLVYPLIPDLDVDTDRSGSIDQVDDFEEDQPSLARGALISGRTLASSSNFVVTNLTELIIRAPSGPQITGVQFRVTRPDDAPVGCRASLFMSDGTQVASDGNNPSRFDLPEWPTNDLHLFAVVPEARKGGLSGSPPVELRVELIVDGIARASDTVAFTVAPFILPPECNPATAIYATEEIAGIANLIVPAGCATAAHPWAQDMVKFGWDQCVSNRPIEVLLELGHPFTENFTDLLVESGCAEKGEWDNSTYDAGNGGNMMATPPMGSNAPFGMVMVGDAHPDQAGFWTNQGVQSVISISTAWLLVGHVDEIFMWVASNKVLFADPWLAADLLHGEIAAGRETEGIWFGTNSAGTNCTIREAVIAAGPTGYKLTTLPVPGLDGTTNAATIAFTNAIFAVGDVLRVDDEILNVLSISGPSVTVARAQAARPPAAHSTGSVIYAYSGVMTTNLPLAGDSVVKKIALACNQLRTALGSYDAQFIPVPVLFDMRTRQGRSGMTAKSANLANCLVAGNGAVYYCNSGCLAFESHMSSNLPGAVAVSAWHLNIEDGSVHCATAARRSLDLVTPWWRQAPTGDH